MEALKAHTKGSSSLTFPGFREEKEMRLGGAHGANYARLVEVTVQYDPDALLRMNLNIKPGH